MVWLLKIKSNSLRINMAILSYSTLDRMMYAQVLDEGSTIPTWGGVQEDKKKEDMKKLIAYFYVRKA